MKAWKVQKFFGDIVYDLRSRGLLPVVALLVVAMVAVPMLLTRGGGTSASSSSQAAATVQTPPEAEQAVVSYSPPGLRDYKKRLDGLSPKNPFHQPPAPSTAATSQLNSTVATPTATASTTSSTGSTSSTPPSVSTGSGSVSGTGTGSGRTTIHRYVYHSVADLSVGDASQPLGRHKHLQPFTSLPDQVAPVMIYLGSSLDGKRAYFSISRSANQLTGPGTCVPSPTDCSLLALSAGQAEDMVYGVDGKTYRVKINKISRVVSKG